MLNGIVAKNKHLRLISHDKKILLLIKNLEHGH